MHLARMCHHAIRQVSSSSCGLSQVCILSAAGAPGHTLPVHCSYACNVWALVYRLWHCLDAAAVPFCYNACPFASCFCSNNLHVCCTCLQVSSRLRATALWIHLQVAQVAAEITALITQVAVAMLAATTQAPAMQQQRWNRRRHNIVAPAGAEAM